MDDTIRYSDLPGSHFTMILSTPEDVNAKTKPKGTRAVRKGTNKSKSADSAENTSSDSEQGTASPPKIKEDHSDSAKGVKKSSSPEAQTELNVGTIEDTTNLSMSNDFVDGNTETASDGNMVHKKDDTDGKPTEAPNGTGNLGNDSDQDHKDTSASRPAAVRGDVSSGHSQADGFPQDASHGEEMTSSHNQSKSPDGTTDKGPIDNHGTGSSSPEMQPNPDGQEIKEHNVPESKGHPTEEEEDKNMSQQPRSEDTANGDLQVNEPNRSLIAAEAQKTSTTTTDGPSSIDTTSPEQSTEEDTSDGISDSTNKHGLTHYTAHICSVTGEAAQTSSSDASDDKVTRTSTGTAQLSEDTAESRSTALIVEGNEAGPTEREMDTESKFSAEDVDKESGIQATSEAPQQDSMPDAFTTGVKEDDIDRARDMKTHPPGAGVPVQEVQEEASLKGTANTEDAPQREGELPEDQKESGEETCHQSPKGGDSERAAGHTDDTTGKVGDDAGMKNTTMHKGNEEELQPSEEENPQGDAAASSKSSPQQQDTDNENNREGSFYKDVWDAILAPENCVLLLLCLLALWLVFWTSSFGNVPYTLGLSVLVIIMHILLRLWVKRGTVV